ncbi:MAG: long-chain fatty acid transporter [Proteobacteria bacterium ST_bin12]|nr:MAG: long-chain fatty acid transporter [Proteobacteria bacterium ST_bin12]
MNKILLTSALLGLAATFPAQATNGYLAHGYGIKSIGAGGVGIALPQDALVIAYNPAGISWLNDRLDVGISYFRPNREAEIEGSATPFNGKIDANDTQDFFIPEFGYKKQLTDKLSFGIAAYGNGGLVQDYDPGFPLFAGPNGPKTGIELLQLFVAPTLAWQVTPEHSVGVSLNIAYQTFEAKGLGAFSALSQAPNNVTDKGKDTAYGLGLHVGWLGKVSENLSLGASYQSRTYTQKFDKYKGLFAEEGDFDTPSIVGLGLAYKVTPDLTVAADYQRINYSDINSVGNSFTFAAPLGSDNGSGFGWRDVNVYKIGAIYNVNQQLTLRTGYNHGSQPVPRDQTLFNVFAPAIVEDHFTLGATWKFENSNELSLSYFHAFEHEVNGRNSIPPAFGGGEANFKMKQDALGIAYSFDF